MKKLLFLLSIVLFVCACDPADTSSKKSSDRFPTPSPSVSQPGNVEWGDNSSSSNGFVSVSLPSSSNTNSESKKLLLELIKNACALEEDVYLESELASLSIDSLTFVGMLVEIEETFDVVFDIELMDIRKWEFVNDIYVCLEAMVNAKKCNR